MAEVTNNTTLYSFMYSWVKKVINTDGGRTLDIQQSHQDVGSPAEPFLTIAYSPIRQKVGRNSKTEPAGPIDPELNEGDVVSYGSYQVRLEFWETGGNGDLLNELINSIERDEIQEFFNAANVAFYSSEPVLPIPSLNGEKWRRESVVEILFGVSSSMIENTGWIETVEFNGNIGGKTI